MSRNYSGQVRGRKEREKKAVVSRNAKKKMMNKKMNKTKNIRIGLFVLFPLFPVASGSEERRFPSSQEQGWLGVYF